MTAKTQKPQRRQEAPQGLRIGIFCNALYMTTSRSQKTVLAMGALIVGAEEDRTKGMVS